jgi:hypothetical protein
MPGLNRRTGKRGSSLAALFRERPWLFPVAGLGIGIICVCLIAGMVNLYQRSSQSREFATPTTLFTELTSTLDIPAQAVSCAGPSLTIGSSSFKVQPIARPDEGLPEIPREIQGVAYWIEDSQPYYVFGLSSTAENQALGAAAGAGAQASLVGEDCNTTVYNLSSPEPYPQDFESLFANEGHGLAILVGPGPHGEGYLLRGVLTGEEFRVIPTLPPDFSDIQAEVELLEYETSPDKTTMSISVAIHNLGSSAIEITGPEVSLTSLGDPALPLVGTDPPIPVSIQPRETQTIYFTFSSPRGETAVFKIFDIEFDVE